MVTRESQTPEVLTPARRSRQGRGRAGLMLAATLVAVLGVVATGGRGQDAALPVAEPAGRPVPRRERAGVRVTAYVATTTHVTGIGRGLPVVLEVTNDSDAPLSVSLDAHSEKMFQTDAEQWRAVAVADLDRPPDGGPRPLAVHARILYPVGVEMMGTAISGARRPGKPILCAPGETVLFKVEVHKAVLQPGVCDLVITLHPHGDTGNRYVARSQSIPMKVVRHDGRPAIQ